jgi:hypothetical protein
MNRNAALAALGAVATVLAVGLTLAPGTVRVLAPLDTAVGRLQAQDPRVLLLLAGAAVGLLGVAVAWGRPRRERSGSGPARLTGGDPEAPATDRRPQPGDGLDGQLDLAVEGDETARRAVRETLRTHAVRRLVAAEGQDGAAAREAVESGTWTGDRLAAAYLGSGPLPLSARVRAWLDPAAEQRRRVRRAVAAVEEVGSR